MPEPYWVLLSSMCMSFMVIVYLSSDGFQKDFNTTEHLWATACASFKASAQMACQQDVTMAICIHLHSKDVCWALSSKSTFGFTFLFTQQRKKEKDRLHQKPKPHIQRHEGMKGYNINHFDGKSVKQKSSLGLLCDASPILCDECQAPCFSWKTTTKVNLDFLIATMWKSHSSCKPAEQTAGCVRWLTLSKSVIVQPKDEDR